MGILNNLIYDIGFHNGADTKYYLERGYNVVGIDANPRLIAQGEKEFNAFVKSGKLRLLNIAVSDIEADLIFNISTEDQFSSLDELAAKRAGIQTTVSVKSKKLSSLFSEYGVPFYCKIDIEGYDAIALQTLDPAKGLPPYISVEVEMVPYKGTITEEDTLFNLNLLKQLGYKKFKLVDQDSLTPLKPGKKFYFPAAPLNYSFLARGLRFLKRKTGMVKMHPQLQHLKDKLGYTFRRDSSGPFGEDIDGEWYNYETARRMILEHRADYHALPSAVYYGFWCDWHAKLE